MTPWSIYEKRLSISGVEQRDRTISREIEAIRRKYLSSPSLKLVVVEATGREQHLLIHSTDIQSEKTFNTLPGETMSIGDIIFWRDMHWLVTKIDFDDEITRSGRMVQCNRKIRWQNKYTGEIIERWCLATKPYTSNISEGLYIATSNREFKIQLTYDDETMLVDLDKRFLLELIDGQPKAYQVVSVDTITNRYEESDGGFLVWNLKQCEFNPVTDNSELMIADYFDCVEQPTPPTGLLRSEISGRDTIRCGASRVYKPLFYMSDGTTVDNTVTPAWTVAGNIAGVNCKDIGGELHVSIADDDSLEGAVITVELTDTNGLYSKATLQVEVIGIL